MIKYVTIQPDNKYFQWQLKVLHQNMIDLDMFSQSITVIGYDRNPSAWAIEYKNLHPDKVFLIKDSRSTEHRKYAPSIRPHLLKKLIHLNPGLLANGWMYHDCDILFTRRLNWESLIQDSTKVYVSDTISYIGSEYIGSKGKGLLEEMCAVVGIEPVLVDINQENSGGAQYLIGKDVEIDWDKIESDGVKLYELTTSTASKYSPDHPLQAWTADMWSMLWNLWQSGYKTKVIPEMNFCWPTDHISEFRKTNIYHNAGVTNDDKRLFYKAAFINRSPFGTDLSYVDKTKCSFIYAQAIDKAYKNNLKMNYRMN